MSSMVYLMCSLPSLSFGQAPPLSLEEFYFEAKNQLSSRQIKALERVDIQGLDQGLNSLNVKSLETMLQDVQSDISEIRSAKVQALQPNIKTLPKQVLTDNPLEREKQIMRYQWEELDTIESGKTFTLIEVLVYKLKLQILSRLHSFSVEKGSALMASIVNPATNSKG